MAGTADLSTILNPPRGFTLQYGQGRVIAWEARTGRNTIEWAGTPIHDVSVLADINALTIQSNDIVGMLGWTSPEGVSSWWVLGRIVSPGEGATDLIIRGNVGVAAGAALFALYPSGQLGVQFGPIWSDATGEHVGHGLMVQSDGPTAEAQTDIFRARQDTDGSRRVYIGQSPADTGQVEAFGSQAAVHNHHAYESMRLQSHNGAPVEIFSDGLLWLYGDVEARLQCQTGPVQIGGATGTFIAPASGAGTAEVRMDSSTGRLTYVSISSTRRVKRDIQPLAVDLDAVLQMQPRSWLPKPAVRQCPDWMHEQHSDEECRAGEVVESPEDDIRQVGFIAEELDEIGLGDFVQYDDEGLPAAISYDRLTAALIPVLQQQQAQIEALTARLDALEQPVEEGS